MYIDLLIVTSGVLVAACVAWSFVRAGAMREKARQRAALQARLQELGKVSQMRRVR